jgi:phage terminase small subunit
MPKLKNKRHEAFCQQYIKELNQTKSYLEVYKDSKPEAAKSNAARLVTNDNIKERIAELMEKRDAKVGREAEEILDDIRRIKEKAERAGRYGDALKALELEGKHKAMWKDKVQLDATVSPHKRLVDRLEEEE